MKKKTILLTLVPLLFAFLVGCSNNSNDSDSQKEITARLTYGTKIQQERETLNELTTEELLLKARDENETFLLATYQGTYSEDCLCWTTFKDVIVNYTNKYKEIIYVYNAQSQDESLSNLNLEKAEDSAPRLYIFEGETKIVSFYYKNNKDKELFEDRKAEALKERIHQYVKRPLLYYDHWEFVQHNEIKYHSSLPILFIRSGCPDCQYVIPNVILPYIKSHNFEIGIRVIDLQAEYEISKKVDATEEEKEHYQLVKDLCNLSETGGYGYGYGEGVVPTIQYYKQGSLEDASVFFNDEVAQKEDGTYYLKNSFYSEERLTSLKYASNVKNNVLKGMSINADDVVGGSYWAQEKAALYHKPLLEAFLDYYCK